MLYKIHLMTNLTNLEVHAHGRPGVCNLGSRGRYLKPQSIENNQPNLNFMYTGDKMCCYIPRLSLN